MCVCTNSELILGLHESCVLDNFQRSSQERGCSIGWLKSFFFLWFIRTYNCESFCMAMTSLDHVQVEIRMLEVHACDALYSRHRNPAVKG